MRSQRITCSPVAGFIRLAAINCRRPSSPAFVQRSTPAYSGRVRIIHRCPAFNRFSSFPGPPPATPSGLENRPSPRIRAFTASDDRSANVFRVRHLVFICLCCRTCRLLEALRRPPAQTMPARRLRWGLKSPAGSEIRHRACVNGDRYHTPGADSIRSTGLPLNPVPGAQNRRSARSARVTEQSALFRSRAGRHLVHVWHRGICRPAGWPPASSLRERHRCIRHLCWIEIIAVAPSALFECADVAHSGASCHS